MFVFIIIFLKYSVKIVCKCLLKDIFQVYLMMYKYKVYLFFYYQYREKYFFELRGHISQLPHTFLFSVIFIIEMTFDL